MVAASRRMDNGSTYGIEIATGRKDNVCAVL